LQSVAKENKHGLNRKGTDYKSAPAG